MAEANAAKEVVMPPDTLRMLADQLYTVLMTLVEGESFDILVGSGSGEYINVGDSKSERIAQRNSFAWTCQAGRAARSSGKTGGLDEALPAMKRRTEWSAPYVGRRHRDGGFGSASP